MILKLKFEDEKLLPLQIRKNICSSIKTCLLLDCLMYGKYNK